MNRKIAFGFKQYWMEKKTDWIDKNMMNMMNLIILKANLEGDYSVDLKNMMNMMNKMNNLN
jgi:hypothetical protein